MKSSYHLLFCLICSICLSCTDDLPITVVHTGLVKNINNEGVLFTGSVQGEGTEKILEYGFVWSTGDQPSLSNSRFKVGDGAVKGEFEQQIRSDISSNTEYNVWAYVINPSTTIFGEAVSFKSNNVEGPVITSFDPISGSSNDVITITGNNFSQRPESNTVKIGSITCTVVSSSVSEMTVKIPDGITSSGRFKISVKTGETTAVSTDDFTLEGPILIAVNPTSAIQGTTITIDGEGFSSVPGDNIVKFGDAVAAAITASETQLTVQVPPTNFAGSVPLTVTVDGITGQFVSLFTIEGPEIFNVNPVQGYPGKVMTITGKNFSNVISENTVLFGGQPTQILEASTTILKVVIPYYLSIDFGTPVSVTVTVTQKPFTRPAAFTALTPWTSAGLFPGTARTYAASFVIGDKGYLGTGSYSVHCSCYMNDFWSFNPQNSSWDQKANFPGAERYHAIGFSVGGKGYILGGITPQGDSDELWEYDATQDQWTQKNSFNYPVTSRFGRVIIINDKAYFLEGTWLFEYNAAQDQWNFLTVFPGSLVSPTQKISFEVNGKIYASGDGKKFYEYDIQLNAWNVKADSPVPVDDGLFDFISFSANGKGYVGGGQNYVNPLNDYSFYRYDAVADNWEQIPSTSVPVQNAAIFVIGGYVYYAMGNRGDYVQANVVKFNPNF